ncbi:unnamed protein product, partial [Rotaria sordida]
MPSHPTITKKKSVLKQRFRNQSVTIPVSYFHYLVRDCYGRKGRPKMVSVGTTTEDLNNFVVSAGEVVCEPQSEIIIQKTPPPPPINYSDHCVIIEELETGHFDSQTGSPILEGLVTPTLDASFYMTTCWSPSDAVDPVHGTAALDLQEDFSIFSTQEKVSSLNDVENLNFNCAVHIDKLEQSKVEEVVHKPKIIVRISNPKALIQKKVPETIPKGPKTIPKGPETFPKGPEIIQNGPETVKEEKKQRNYLYSISQIYSLLQQQFNQEQ